jgi:hypothetical protein
MLLNGMDDITEQVHVRGKIVPIMLLFPNAFTPVK